MTNRWLFSPLGNGTIEGFNQPGIDLWQGSTVYSVIRETIQNSIDARSSDVPAKVSFSFEEVSTPEELNELNAYLQSGMRRAVGNRAAEADAHSISSFYENAIAEVSAPLTTFLCIQDYNTSGLVGTLDPLNSGYAESKWLALVNSTGATAQTTTSAGGSYGHGSLAPFAITTLRTLFYLTQCKHEGGVQKRFQGKSILQSMELPESPGSLSQGTGYYSNVQDGKSIPVLDELIPSWAIDLRDKYGTGTGTSLFIPSPRIKNDSRSQLALKTVILANFYAAILNGYLEVLIADEILNAESVVEQFEGLLVQIENAHEDLFEEHKSLAGNLESAKTIHRPDHSGTKSLADFGEFDWYLRIGDECRSSKVGICRKVGMLITRNASGLIRFDNTRAFDLLVIVKGDAGNEKLRKLENPAHDAFEFDRLTDPMTAADIKRIYRAFTATIKEIVKEFAEVDVVNESVIRDFDDFFSGGQENSDEEGDKALSSTIIVGPPRIIKPSPQNNSVNEGDSDDDVPGAGQTGGPGTTIKPGGSNPDPDGKGVAKGSSAQVKRTVKNLRFVPRAGSNIATVIFTITDPGARSIALFRSGEKFADPVKMRIANSTSEFGPTVPITDGNTGVRKTLEIEFESETLNFALEGQTIHGD